MRLRASPVTWSISRQTTLSRLEFGDADLYLGYGWPSGHTLPLEELVRRLTNADIDVKATTPGLLEIPFLLEGTHGYVTC